jgi:hypothetical protein
MTRESFGLILMLSEENLCRFTLKLKKNSLTSHTGELIRHTHTHAYMNEKTRGSTETHTHPSGKYDSISLPQRWTELVTIHPKLRGTLLVSPREVVCVSLCVCVDVRV